MVHWGSHGAQQQRGSMVREAHWGLLRVYWGRPLFQFTGEAMERSSRGWGFTGADPCFSLLGRPWSAAAEGQHAARSSLGFYCGVTGADPCFSFLGRPWSAAVEGGSMVREAHWGVTGEVTGADP